MFETFEKPVKSFSEFLKQPPESLAEPNVQPDHVALMLCLDSIIAKAQNEDALLDMLVIRGHKALADGKEMTKEAYEAYFSGSPRETQLPCEPRDEGRILSHTRGGLILDAITFGGSSTLLPPVPSREELEALSDNDLEALNESHQRSNQQANLLCSYLRENLFPLDNSSNVTFPIHKNSVVLERLQQIRTAIATDMLRKAPEQQAEYNQQTQIFAAEKRKLTRKCDSYTRDLEADIRHELTLCYQDFSTTERREMQSELRHETKNHLSLEKFIALDENNALKQRILAERPQLKITLDKYKAMNSINKQLEKTYTKYDVPALENCAKQQQSILEKHRDNQFMQVLGSVFLFCISFGLAPKLWQHTEAGKGHTYFDFLKPKTRGANILKELPTSDTDKSTSPTPRKR
jgi:hypothetical protein